MPSADIAWLLLPELLSALLFAAAAFGLFRLSGTIRDGVNQLSGRSHEPYVTVSLEPSAAGRRFLDLVVENSGFAPAFDIKVTTTPEIPTDPERGERPAGWSDVSLLRPGQSMVSYACPAEAVENTEFAIEVSWKRTPAARDRFYLQYRLDMRNYNLQAAYPAPPPPRSDLANELRRMRLEWRDLARGERPFRIELGEEALRALLGAEHRREERDADRREEPKPDRKRSDSREPGREAARLNRHDDAEGPVESAPVSLSEARPRR